VNEGSYRPPYAPWVLGTFNERRMENGLPVEQKVKMTCEFAGCGGSWQTTCNSGHVRTHIQRFANQHLHRDPMSPLPPRTT
jgi:hypothetical protein